MAQAGSLDSTLTALTELVAQEHNKSVVLDCIGMQLVPPRYQATIKNVAIQLIRNAVMHGVESPDRAPGSRQAGARHAAPRVQDHAGSKLRTALPRRRLRPGSGQGARHGHRQGSDHRGRRGAAARSPGHQIDLQVGLHHPDLRPPGEAAHGSGMSLVRRYVHEAGGKIALATLLGHETRFKVTLPALAAADAQVA